MNGLTLYELFNRLNYVVQINYTFLRSFVEKKKKNIVVGAFRSFSNACVESDNFSALLYCKIFCIK